MIAALSLMLVLGVGEVYEDALAQANHAYRQGQYAEAIEEYRQIVAAGVREPAVFCNLGNAHYLEGRIGHAVANFERALCLDPGFEKAKNGLTRALAKSERQLPRPPRAARRHALFFWDTGLSENAVRRLAVLFWVACWATLGLRLWRPWPYARSLALLCALLALACAGSYWAKTHSLGLAVAVEDGAAVRYGNDAGQSVHFELFGGDRVRAEKRVDGWVRVATADGKRGWTQASKLLFVGPPFVPLSQSTLASEERDGPDRSDRSGRPDGDERS